jgi:hypothetical protein
MTYSLIAGNRISHGCIIMYPPSAIFLVSEFLSLVRNGQESLIEPGYSNCLSFSRRCLSRVKISHNSGSLAIACLKELRTHHNLHGRC